MAAPRSGDMEKVQFKLPKATVQKMDSLIQEETFSTRTEFLRHLVENYFAEERAISNLDTIVNERIEEGRYDDVLKERLKKILSDKL